MRRFAIIFLCALLISMPSYAQQAQLLSINYGEAKSKQFEVDFLFSGAVTYKKFLLASPSRLVVDFNNAILLNKTVLSAEKSLFIERVRSAPRDNSNLRVVFDFKAGVKPNSIKIVSGHLNDGHVVLNLSVTSALGHIKPTLSDTPKQEASHIAIPDAVPAHIQSSVEEDDEQSEDEVSTESYFSKWDFTGKVAIEDLGFFHHRLDPQQHNNYISGSIEPEIYREWDDGKQSFTFSPFFRYSQHDSKRTHFDIRELTWLLSEEDWELRVGFREVFWGVAEGLHLVNIINQTDLVENTDTEDKLGQPMVNLALIRDWGTIDLFILPGFRERTFPGQEGRLRTFPEFSVGEAEFEHYGIEKHMAYAARWSQVLGDWDVGFSHFHGTSREPSFKTKASPSGLIQLIPYYELINQTAVDLQLTHEDWIFKHEGIVREGQGNTFYAMTTGVEYTLFDLFRSGLDLGLVVEYMYDTRGANNFLAPFQDDILTAFRFGFNDVQSTEILAGVMFDRTNNSRFYNIEASRRLGDSFKIDLELRFFSGAPANDPSFSFREDDHIRVEVGYYF